MDTTTIKKQSIRLFFLASFYSILLFTSSAWANETVTLQLKWKHQFQFAGYYAAIEQGYYNEEGLDVVLVEGKPGGSEVEEVLSGRADYGIGMSDILLSRLQGKPIILLANIFQHSPVTLLTLKESYITSPQDLYQKKIRMAVNAKSAELQAMFLNEGVQLEDLNLLKPNWDLNELISGQVDAIAAYISSQPFILKKKSIPYTLISPATYGIDFYGDNIFTSENEIHQHPERAAAFRRASLKGWAYALENKDEIIELILSKYSSPSKRDVLESEATVYEKLILPRFVKLGHTNPGRWEHIAQTYARLGLAGDTYSLEGFFYQPERKVFNWDHWFIKLSSFILFAVTCSSCLLFFFNRRLQREMQSHKQTAQQLQENEELFRALFEQSGGYCMILDPNTSDGIPVIVDANKAACSMHGYERDEFIGQPVSLIDDEEGRRLVRKRTEEIMKGDPFYVENEHIRKDGTSFAVSVNAKRIDVGDNPPIILSTEYDITEKKKAEKELIEREEQYRAVVENTGDAITRHDRNCKHIYANRNAMKIAGKNPEHYLEKTHRDLGYPAHICELWEQNIKRVFATGKSRRIEFDLDLPGTRKSFDLQLNPEFSDEGNVQSVIGISRDITGQKLLEVQLRQAQKMESIGTLAGGIAHDFNNILSSLIGFTELALDSVENESDMQDDLQEVYAAGMRAKALVRQILTFARQSDEQVEPLQVQPIIEEVIKFLRSTIPSTIEIRHKNESESFVMGSETQIHQIVMNLCNNAAQAMEEDGGVLDISLNDILVDKTHSSQKVDLKHGKYVVIKVADTGPGMEPYVMEKIFDPYFTTKKTGEGTGLGLALVHGIVESYNGKILVDSVVGKGTTFTIYLPACEKEQLDFSPNSDVLPSGRERILLVDDEEVITKMGNRILSKLGYSVTIKNSSLEALELFRANPGRFDLVMSDVTMPKMTGLQLAGELLKIRENIPVILCTGYSKNVSSSSATEIGVKAFVNKPIVKADLANIVREVLDEATTGGAQ